MDVSYSRKMALWFLIGVALIFVCYYQVDKAMAGLAYSDDWRRYHFLQWLTYLAPAIIAISLFSIIYATIKCCLRRYLSVAEKAFFVGGLNTIITVQINNLLKIVFGRTWPATWINNNPSWLNSHVYGFHFFRGGKAYASFPSGHTAVVFAMITVLWFGVPKWRCLYAIIGFGIIVGIVGMYYHFVSDVIAGALLGILTGILAARAFLKLKFL